MLRFFAMDVLNRVDARVGDIWRLRHRPTVRFEITRLQWGAPYGSVAVGRIPGRAAELPGHLSAGALLRKWELEFRPEGEG